MLRNAQGRRIEIKAEIDQRENRKNRSKYKHSEQVFGKHNKIDKLRAEQLARRKGKSL